MSNLPKLRFKEFSGEWEITKLGNIAKVTMGQSPNSDSYNEDCIGIPLVQGNADCTNRKTTPRVYTSQPTKQCFIDDIIMTVRAPVGAVSKSYHNACIGRGVCAIKAKESNEFLYQVLVNYEDKWAKYSQGSTFTAVNSNDIKGLALSFPSKPEQEKIASFLTSVDAKIELLVRKEELLQQYKKGVMQKIFSQEIRFKADDGSAYPKWQEKKIKELFTYKNGGSFESDVVEDGLYNLITLNSIDINGELKSIHKRVNIDDNSLSKNDLIMVLSDVAHGNFLGLTAIIPEDNAYVLNQRMGALKPKTKDNNAFIRMLINFNQKYFKLHGQGSSQQNLSKGDIEKFIVNLPCLEEQTKIANFLSSIDSKIKHIQKQLNSTKAFKKALLQQMFV